MRLSKSVAAFALLFATVAAGALAADRGWKLLGERTVTDGVDHDSIAVTAAEGDLEALQIRVRGRAVQFREVRVHYANGDEQVLELRDVIPAGGSSRVLDLAGDDRIVRRVEFRYDAQSAHGKKALIRLFGKR